MNDVFVVIPAYNEEKHIGFVIQGVKRSGFNKVIVVDDCSTDETGRIAKGQEAIVLRNKKNKGKAYSLRRGCDYAVKKGAKSIVVMDGDGQHDPKEIKKLVRALKKAELIIGYRRLTKEMPLFYKIGNLFFDITHLLLTFKWIKDTQSGFRAFKTEAYKKIRWNGKGYSCESEMILNALKNKIKITQVPIKTIYLERHKGTSLLDGFKVLFRIIRTRFK